MLLQTQLRVGAFPLLVFIVGVDELRESIIILNLNDRWLAFMTSLRNISSSHGQGATFTVADSGSGCQGINDAQPDVREDLLARELGEADWEACHLFLPQTMR